MKTKLHFLFIVLALLASYIQTARATVTFTNTPAAVSNTYTGTITLQIGGLTNTETVVIQKYLDLNTNGIIDSGDLLVQQFSLTDGQAGMVIGGVTNFNVPGDLNAATGAITATLNFQNGDIAQNIIGKYLYKLSSPAGHFTPLTNSFTVTNFPFAQKFTGNVVSNSTSVTVSNAIVILLPPVTNQGSPLAGVVANNAGSYTIAMPPGTYSLLVYRSNYVSEYTGAPVLTLAAGQTLTTNLTLTKATSTISGKVVDANNSSLGLPGANFFAQSADGLFALAFSDINGNFTMPVTADTWDVNLSDQSVTVLGYLGLQNGTNVSAGKTGLTFACPKATALVYGSVKDILGNPMVALDVNSFDNNNLYQTDAYTETNGNYVLGVVGFGSSDSWQVQANGNNQLINYVFSQPVFDQNGGTNINAGKVVLANFTAIPATNTITGNVKFNGTNVIGVGVSAYATINGVSYNLNNVDTDANGNYSLTVANGTWSVNVSCQGGNDSLNNILGSGNYQCPNSQNITINNNNATGVDFIILPSSGSGSGQIFGYVMDTSGNPVVGVNVYANDGVEDNYTNATDGSGYYAFSVGDENWNVSVDCTGLNTLGYECVSGQTVGVSDDFVEQDFTVQPINPQPVLGLAIWRTNSFQMLITATANLNYTVQMSTNLSSTNWISLYVTNNPTTSSFNVVDPNATNNQRFYRILTGP
jgi:hypothetical protein